MNEHEIDQVYEEHKGVAGSGGDAVRILKDFKDFINKNIGGWTYCVPASNATRSLTKLLRDRGVAGRMFPSPPITEKELRKAVAPIRALCTRKNLSFVPHTERSAGTGVSARTRKT